MEYVAGGAGVILFIIGVVLALRYTRPRKKEINVEIDLYPFEEEVPDAVEVDEKIFWGLKLKKVKATKVDVIYGTVEYLGIDDLNTYFLTKTRFPSPYPYKFGGAKKRGNLLTVRFVRDFQEFGFYLSLGVFLSLALATLMGIVIYWILILISSFL